MKAELKVKAPQSARPSQKGSTPMRALSEAMSETHCATRFEWQQSLEANLALFNPDAVEASELLCALAEGLRNRYDPGQLTEANHRIEQLKEALEEIDKKCCKVSPEDEAYDAFRARQECDGE